MKILYLVRHAKSSWDDNSLDDKDRPLKKGGVKDAYSMSAFLKENSILPDYLISSPAVRALSTAVIFAGQMGYPEGKIKIDMDLYESTSSDILNIIKKTDNTLNTLMIFGHEPSLTGLFMVLTGQKLIKIPTSAVVSISFDTNQWDKIIPDAGTLQFLYKPKEIKSMLNNDLES